MEKIYKSVVILSILSVAGVAIADESSSPPTVSNLFQTSTVFPNEKGEVSIFVLPSYNNEHLGEYTTSWPVSITYGVTDAFMLTVGWTPVMTNNVDGNTYHGSSDIKLGTQYSFMNINNSNFSAALAFTYSQPQGDINKGMTQGFRTYEPTALFNEDLPNLNHVNLFSQVGFDFVEKVESVSSGNQVIQQPPTAHSFFLDAGFYIPVGSMRYVSQINWNNNRWNHNGTTDALYFSPGIIWEAAKKLELGISAPIGLTYESDYYQILAEVTYDIDLL